MQQLPLLVPSDLDIKKPISAFWGKQYGKKTIADAVAILDTVQRQRQICCGIRLYQSSNDFIQYKCYFDYLCQLEKCAPLSGDKGIKINFSWTSAFNRKKMTCTDIIFEKACVLYNIAALYTQAAYDMYSVEDQSEERFRTCIGFLRSAAAFFSELCENYAQRLQTLQIGNDFDPKVLRIYYLITMAQGQHMYYAMARAMNLANAALVVLLAYCSTYYNELYELCSANKYLPKDLAKHFKLQYHFTRISAYHFFGIDKMKRESENSGLLYALANELDKEMNEARKFMTTFHLEVADQQQGEAIFNLVKNDKQEYYRIYRIYYGAVPETVTIPEGRSKMEKAETLDITPVPLGIETKLPASADSDEAVSKYEEKRSTIVDECKRKYEAHEAKVKSILHGCLLPELLTGEGMQAGLPKTISDHKKQVDQRGSTIHLRETIDNILCIIDNAETQYKEFERSIETASPHRETVDWIGVTLKQVKKDYAENEKKLREMEKNPDIFRKSETDLSISLPKCAEYPTDMAPVSVKNACDSVLRLMTLGKEYMRTLETDRSGESIVRNRVQADGSLINIKTIIEIEGTQSLKSTVRRIEDNMKNEDSLVGNMVSEYKKWIKTRTVTPDMKKREEALKNVLNMLTLYDACEESCAMMTEVLDLVNSKIKELCNVVKN